MPASSRQSDIEYNTLQTKSARSHQICRPLADFLQNLTNFKIRFNFQLAILIPTKFCTVINTTKFSLSSQNLSHESKMANSLHLKKKDKFGYISATVPLISAKFCMLTHTGSPNPKHCSKNQIFKNPRWQTAAILKIVKCDISATMTILIKFGTTMHISNPKLMGDQMYKNLKIQEGGWRPSWK